MEMPINSALFPNPDIHIFPMWPDFFHLIEAPKWGKICINHQNKKILLKNEKIASKSGKFS